MKCKKCKRAAEYIIPTTLCLRHWAEWFVEGTPFPTEEDRKRDIRNIMRRARYAEKKNALGKIKK